MAVVVNAINYSCISLSYYDKFVIIEFFKGNISKLQSFITRYDMKYKLKMPLAVFKDRLSVLSKKVVFCKCLQ